MTMRLLQTVFLILLSVGIFAQDTLHTENSVLWKISGKGLEHDSYLFGTIHLIPEDSYFFTENMRNSFNECDVLALEIDINMSVFEQLKLAKKSFLPDNTTLKDYMDKEDYNFLSQFILDSLEMSNLEWQSMNKMKPIFSSILILNKFIEKPVTYEQELNEMAKKNKMTVIGLETANYQLDVLNKIPIEEQVEMLKPENIDMNPLDEFLELVDIYKSQEINSMLEMFYEDESMLKFEDELLIQRNKNWIPIIEKHILKKSLFIAVGAMHLPGEYGLINLLKQNGYSLTPVNIHE
jgi:uncharacterized protein YbaP (TraB family)